MLTYEAAAPPQRRARDAVVVTVPALVLTLVSSQPMVVQALGWVNPDWALAASIYLALRTRLWHAALAACVLGFLGGAMTLTPEGLTPLALLILTLIAARAGRVARFHGYAQSAAILVAAALIRELVVVPGLLSIMGQGRPLTGAIMAVQAQKALATGLVGPLMLYFFDKILSALDSRR